MSTQRSRWSPCRIRSCKKKEESAALSEQVAQLQQDNNVLQDSIDNLQTSAGIEAIARNKLGLVKDGEIVFYDNGE